VAVAAAPCYWSAGASNRREWPAISSNAPTVSFRLRCDRGSGAATALRCPSTRRHGCAPPSSNHGDNGRQPGEPRAVVPRKAPAGQPVAGCGNWPTLSHLRGFWHPWRQPRFSPSNRQAIADTPPSLWPRFARTSPKPWSASGTKILARKGRLDERPSGWRVSARPAASRRLHAQGGDHSPPGSDPFVPPGITHKRPHRFIHSRSTRIQLELVTALRLAGSHTGKAA